MATLAPLATVDPTLIEALLDRAFGPERHARTAYRIREGTEWLPTLSFAVADDEGYLVGTIQCWPVALTDPEGRPYFQAMIEIDSESLAEHEGMILSPGMAAQLEIVTGARTILAYLFAPITDSFDRAFREQ